MPVTTAPRECTDTKVRQLLRSIERDYEAELAVVDDDRADLVNLLRKLAATFGATNWTEAVDFWRWTVQHHQRRIRQTPFYRSLR